MADLNDDGGGDGGGAFDALAPWGLTADAPYGLSDYNSSSSSTGEALAASGHSMAGGRSTAHSSHMSRSRRRSVGRDGGEPYRGLRTTDDAMARSILVATMIDAGLSPMERAYLNERPKLATILAQVQGFEKQRQATEGGLDDATREAIARVVITDNSADLNFHGVLVAQTMPLSVPWWRKVWDKIRGKGSSDKDKDKNKDKDGGGGSGGKAGPKVTKKVCHYETESQVLSGPTFISVAEGVLRSAMAHAVCPDVTLQGASASIPEHVQAAYPPNPSWIAAALACSPPEEEDKQAMARGILLDPALSKVLAANPTPSSAALKSWADVRLREAPAEAVSKYEQARLDAVLFFGDDEPLAHGKDHHHHHHHHHKEEEKEVMIMPASGGDSDGGDGGDEQMLMQRLSFAEFAERAPSAGVDLDAGWWSKLRQAWMGIRTTKPQPMFGPDTADRGGRLKADDEKLLEFAQTITNIADWRDLALVEGVQVASGEKRAQGSVSFTVIGRMQLEGTKTQDETLVNARSVSITKLHMGGLHLNHLKVDREGLRREKFLDFHSQPGMVRGRNMRLDLSKYAGGQVAIEYAGEASATELATDEEMTNMLWISPGSSLTLVLVWDKRGGNPLADTLQSILVLDKKRTKKEGKGGGGGGRASTKEAIQTAVKATSAALNACMAAPTKAEVESALSAIAADREGAGYAARYALAHGFAVAIASHITEHDVETHRTVTFSMGRPGASASTTNGLAQTLRTAVDAVEAAMESVDDAHAFASALKTELGYLARARPVQLATACCMLVQAADARTPGSDGRTAAQRAHALWDTRGDHDTLGSFSHPMLFSS